MERIKKWTKAISDTIRYWLPPLLLILLIFTLTKILYSTLNPDTSSYDNIIAMAKMEVADENYDLALDLLSDIRYDYPKANEYAREIEDLQKLDQYYTKGCAYLGSREYVVALGYFTACIDYKDSNEKFAEALYEYQLIADYDSLSIILQDLYIIF